MAIDYNNLVDSQFKKKPEDSNWGSMDYLPGYLTGLRKKKPVINVNKYDANPNGTTQNDVIPNQPVIRESADTGTSQPNFNVPKTNAPVIPEQPKPDAYNEYWKTPVVGKMPLDQFVQMAGMLSNSLAPDTPMGRLGGELYKQGSIVSAERARREYEAPEKNLRTRLLNAQINQAEQKAPEAWDSMYNALNNTLNPKTGKLYTQPEIVKEFETAKAIPKEYKPTYKFVSDEKGNLSTFMDGELIKGTGKGVDITNQIATTKEDDKGNVTLISKAGDVVKTIPNIGKTKTTSALTFDQRKQLQENAAQLKAKNAGSQAKAKRTFIDPETKNIITQMTDGKYYKTDQAGNLVLTAPPKNMVGVGNSNKAKDDDELRRQIAVAMGITTPESKKATTQKPGSPKNAKGWLLHTDKNGNKAYVSPDGKQFEEVK